MFFIDWLLFVTQYLPPNKREAVTIAFLKACLVTVEEKHDEIFNVFYPYITDRAKHNGQKIIMEKILNDTFLVPGPPWIYIDNTGDDIRGDSFFNEGELLPVHLYNESEGQPPLYMVNEVELSENNTFIVYVPSAIYTSVGENVIAGEVDRLRPYSTKYTIISY